MANEANDKRLAAEAAVVEVTPGLRVGLGTGSTVAYFIDALAARVRDGLAIRAVATSLASEERARAGGIAIDDFAEVAHVDLTVDGADELDPRFYAIKGAGGALLREKIVAAASARMVVIADGSKQVAAIGAAKLPVEVIPFARAFVAERLAALGAAVTPRDSLTDNGNLILDARFAAFPEPRDLARALEATPGVMGHGLFLDEVDAAYVARDGVVTRLERAAPRR